MSDEFDFLPDPMADDDGGTITSESGKKPKKNADNKQIKAAKKKTMLNESATGLRGKLSDLQEKREEQKKRKNGNIIRIEELEKQLANNEDIDIDQIISTYMPHRRARSIGAAILRLDKLRMFVLVALLLVAGLFIMAFMQEKMGNFTINLDRLELFRKGVSMSADADFTDPTARLTASTVQDATNITLEDLPANIDNIDGDHNGRNYMAYTYYVRNAGKETVNYTAAVTLDKCAKGAEEAVRVVVWKNGERTVYAAPSSTGEPEEGCVNFVSSNVVCEFTETEFLVGNVDKYTVVIFMEGEDPQCNDAIVGGSVEFSMNIYADDEENTSLLVKFVQDIIDTIRGDKAIGAAGTEAPNYYFEENINWHNRRNQ